MSQDLYNALSRTHSLPALSLPEILDGRPEEEEASFLKLLTLALFVGAVGSIVIVLGINYSNKSLSLSIQVDEEEQIVPQRKQAPSRFDFLCLKKKEQSPSPSKFKAGRSEKKKRTEAGIQHKLLRMDKVSLRENAAAIAPEKKKPKQRNLFCSCLSRFSPLQSLLLASINGLATYVVILALANFKYEEPSTAWCEWAEGSSNSYLCEEASLQTWFTQDLLILAVSAFACAVYLSLTASILWKYPLAVWLSNFNAHFNSSMEQKKITKVPPDYSYFESLMRQSEVSSRLTVNRNQIVDAKVKKMMRMAGHEQLSQTQASNNLSAQVLNNFTNSSLLDPQEKIARRGPQFRMEATVVEFDMKKVSFTDSYHLTMKSNFSCRRSFQILIFALLTIPLLAQALLLPKIILQVRSTDLLWKLLVLTIASLILQHIFFMPLINLLGGPGPARSRRANPRPVESVKLEEMALADKVNDTSSVKMEAEKKTDKYISVDIQSLEELELLLKASTFKRDKPRFLAQGEYDLEAEDPLNESVEMSHIINFIQNNHAQQKRERLSAIKHSPEKESKAIGSNTVMNSEDSAHKKSQSIGITTSSKINNNAFESIEKLKDFSKFKTRQRDAEPNTDKQDLHSPLKPDLLSIDQRPYRDPSPNSAQEVAPDMVIQKSRGDCDLKKVSSQSFLPPLGARQNAHIRDFKYTPENVEAYIQLSNAKQSRHGSDNKNEAKAQLMMNHSCAGVKHFNTTGSNDSLKKEKKSIHSFEMDESNTNHRSTQKAKKKVPLPRNNSSNQILKFNRSSDVRVQANKSKERYSKQHSLSNGGGGKARQKSNRSVEVKKPPIPQKTFSDTQYRYYDAEYDSEYDSDYEYTEYDYEEDDSDEVIPPPKKIQAQQRQGQNKQAKKKQQDWDFISPEPEEKGKAKQVTANEEELKGLGLTPEPGSVERKDAELKEIISEICNDKEKTSKPNEIVPKIKPPKPKDSTRRQRTVQKSQDMSRQPPESTNLLSRNNSKLELDSMPKDGEDQIFTKRLDHLDEQYQAIQENQKVSHTVRIAADKGKKANLPKNPSKPTIQKDEMKLYNEAQISPSSPTRFKKQTTEAVQSGLKQNDQLLQKRQMSEIPRDKSRDRSKEKSGSKKNASPEVPSRLQEKRKSSSSAMMEGRSLKQQRSAGMGSGLLNRESGFRLTAQKILGNEERGGRMHQTQEVKR